MRNFIPRFTTFTFLLILFSSSGSGSSGDTLAEFSNESKDSKIIELFTSEGCSSCPPAEKWMNQLSAHNQLWKNLFPVVFHVDYWDYLGWKDKLASPEYSERQRNYVRKGRGKSVYTPGFFLNGKEWRSWFNDQNVFPEFPQTKGVLKAKVQQGGITVSYSGSSRNTILSLSIMQSGLFSVIKGGENAGKKLDQDFIVREFITVTEWENDGFIPFRNKINSGEKMALVIWLTDEKTGDLIQVTGGEI